MKPFASTLDTFSEVSTLRDTHIKLATLSIVLCEEVWSRYHRFTPNWSEGVDMAEIDNGSGDRVTTFFAEKDCVIKGFDHESPVSPHAQAVYQVWDGMYQGLPLHLEALLDNPSVEKEEVTFCVWQTESDTHWHQGEVVYSNGEDNGLDYLLGMIYSTPEGFKDWADAYFDTDLPVAALAQVYRGAPVTRDMIQALNPERDPVSVQEELSTLGVAVR